MAHGAVTGRRPWLRPGVGGIGTASFLADVGHEVPPSLMASFVTSTLGRPPPPSASSRGSPRAWPAPAGSSGARRPTTRAGGGPSAFGYLAAWMLLALGLLGRALRS